MVIILSVLLLLVIVINIRLARMLGAHIIAKERLIEMFTNLVVSKGIKYEEIVEFLDKQIESQNKAKNAVDK
jgi:hypothetical protein